MTSYFDDPSSFRGNRELLPRTIISDDYIDPLVGARVTVSILRSENARFINENNHLSIELNITKKAIEFLRDWFDEHELYEEKNKDRTPIYAKLDGRCFYCGTRLDDGWHIEHMIPKSHGGKSSPENLTPSCAHCNLTKSSRTLEGYRSFLSGKVKKEIVFFGELIAMNKCIFDIALSVAIVRVAWDRRNQP